MCTLEKRGSIYILTLTGNHDHRLNPTLVDSLSAALHRIRSETTASHSPGAALITTGEGKYFSNGGDISWVDSNKDRLLFMISKVRSLLTDLMSLPMPTIAALNGHAAGQGYILALCHDYVLMRKDRGFLYMSGLDIGEVLPTPFFKATLEAKVSSPAVLRDIVLRAEKMTAEKAVKKGIIHAAYDSVEATVAAAVELGGQLARRNWNGQVYAENRKVLFYDVLQKLAIAETDEMIKNSRVLELKPRL
ncbi:enoyl-CoA delta isomerase 1, peroxisomal-like [Apium graveolens]|uniref:enoyl-CoA delta isomerase 1, peroxisomal-like n=1 Tax=Apium graveolens TaxID=4045 RepID=UPI003D7B79C7